jgi:hypothetical protein
LGAQEATPRLTMGLKDTKGVQPQTMHHRLLKKCIFRSSSGGSGDVRCKAASAAALLLCSSVFDIVSAKSALYPAPDGCLFGKVRLGVVF